MNKKDKDLFEKIKTVLIKKAEGYYYNEEIFEYQKNNEQKIIETKKIKESGSSELKNEILEVQSNQNNKPKENKEMQDLILLKKKITTHYIPPDLLAIKMLVEIFGEKIDSTSELQNLTTEELENLKNDLIEKLKN